MFLINRWGLNIVPITKKKKLHGQGGPGRGQGNKPLHENKRVKISANIPPSMLERIKALKKTTGDSLSSTVVWVLDHGLPVVENKK